MTGQANPVAASQVAVTHRKSEEANQDPTARTRFMRREPWRSVGICDGRYNAARASIPHGGHLISVRDAQDTLLLTRPPDPPHPRCLFTSTSFLAHPELDLTTYPRTGFAYDTNLAFITILQPSDPVLPSATPSYTRTLSASVDLLDLLPALV